VVAGDHVCGRGPHAELGNLDIEELPAVTGRAAAAARAPSALFPGGNVDTLTLGLRGCGGAFLPGPTRGGEIEGEIGRHGRSTAGAACAVADVDQATRALSIFGWTKVAVFTGTARLDARHDWKPRSTCTRWTQGRGWRARLSSNGGLLVPLAAGDAAPAGDVGEDGRAHGGGVNNSGSRPTGSRRFRHRRTESSGCATNSARTPAPTDRTQGIIRDRADRGHDPRPLRLPA